MCAPPDDTTKSWYILHYIRKSGDPSPRQHIDDFNKHGHALELFAPIIRPAEVINGKVVFKEKLLTFYYVFVRGSLAEIKALCSRTENNLSMMLDRGGSRRYATIRDADMDRFKIIANAHVNSIPFFNIGDIELEEGDKVEVVDGIYAGLTGTFMPKSRSSKGNIVIAASATTGAIVWDIDAKYVRILEFAKNTRRPYDIIDAFIPKLFAILRKYASATELSNKEKSQLAVFSSRMCAARLNNPKLEAKLLAVLMCAQQITGDDKSLQDTRLRFEKRKQAITNPWTLALIALLSAVADHDIDRLKDEYDKLRAVSDGLTASQSGILKEYEFYLDEKFTQINI